MLAPVDVRPLDEILTEEGDASANAPEPYLHPGSAVRARRLGGDHHRRLTGGDRQKLHHADPMTLDDAVYEMEMVGHDFYLFIDKETSAPRSSTSARAGRSV